MQEDPPPTGFFERIIDWIVRGISPLLNNTFTEKVLPYILLVAAIILVVWLASKGEYRGVLSRKRYVADQLKIEEIEEQIEGRDFDRMIAEAEGEGNYRKAARLLYLQSLQRLNEQGLIEWKPDKTNRDYLSELRGFRFDGDFSRLTRLFDFVWYGGFELSSDDYRETRRAFRDFTQGVERGA